MLDRDTLYRLYVIDRKTGIEIAKKAGVSTSTVYNWLDKHDIPRRGKRAAQRPVTPSKETLERLYLNEQKSVDEIWRLLGSSESSISKLLDKYGIPKRKSWEKMAGWNKGKPLPKAQRHHLSKIAKMRTGKKSPRYGAVLSGKTRRKIADSLKGRFRGPDNSNWNGGSRYERQQWHSRYEYKEWRAAVYERDNYTCQMCKKQSKGDIEAHHILPWRDYPKRRFDVANGITLCVSCHRSIKGVELDYADQFFEITHQPSP